MSENYSRPRPICFGQIDTVFPVADSGLREIPDACRECGLDHDCLKMALQSPEGRRFLAEKTGQDQGAAPGDDPPSPVAGFLKRWSDRKLAGRKRRQ